MFDIVVNKDTNATAPTANSCDTDANAPLRNQYDLEHEQQSVPPMLSINASKGPPLIPQQPAPRFESVLAERDERTRLVLEPRTRPLELPPYQQLNMTELKASAEAKRKAIKERNSNLAEKKKSILASAFASDDEGEIFCTGSDEESDWDVGEAMYAGSSDEEE